MCVCVAARLPSPAATREPGGGMWADRLASPASSQQGPEGGAGGGDRGGDWEQWEWEFIGRQRRHDDVVTDGRTQQGVPDVQTNPSVGFSSVM